MDEFQKKDRRSEIDLTEFDLTDFKEYFEEEDAQREAEAKEKAEREAAEEAARLAEEETRLVVERGKAGAAFIDHPASGNCLLMRPHFRDPVSVERSHFKIAKDIHAETHQLVQLQRCITGVFQHSPAGQNRIKNRVIQLQSAARLFQNDLQCFLTVLGLGQALGHGRDTLKDPTADKSEIHRFSVNFDTAFPVVTPAIAGKLQRHDIRAAGRIFLIQNNAAAPAKARLAGKCLMVLRLNRRAKMQMLRQSVPIDPQQIGIFFRRNMKNLIHYTNHIIHV